MGRTAPAKVVRRRDIHMSILGPDTGRSLCDSWEEIHGASLTQWQNELIRRLQAGLLTQEETRRSMGLPPLR